ncbi:hypothetical protein FBU30_005031 [Linnemannia zychae]|nr:hypothetical protein FBU30_005031 [Linnemannia zychae]
MSYQDKEEEEEDYMSEAFLNSLVEESKSKSKATMTYSERRRQKEREHLANLPKPLHIREKEAREQGLEKEIGEENKGMAMLLKMGFKKGGTLGAIKPPTDTATTSISQETPGKEPADVNSSSRNHDNNNALRTPLAIHIKQGRGGLGMDTSRKRQAEEILQKQEQETLRVFDEDFRGQKRDQFEQEKRKRQLGAARGICMRLDAKKIEARSQEEKEKDTSLNLENIEGQRSNKFWWIDDSLPDEVLGTKMMGPGAEVSVDVEHNQQHTSEEVLDGHSYDQSDSEDSHREQGVVKRIRLDSNIRENFDQDTSEDIEPPKWGERPSFAQLEIYDKLKEVVAYLRSEHSYCFWCSAQYDGPDDISENCPGESEDDH